MCVCTSAAEQRRMNEWTNERTSERNSARVCVLLYPRRPCVCQCKQQTRIFLSFARQRAKKGEEKCAVAFYTGIANGQRSLSRAEHRASNSSRLNFPSLFFHCMASRMHRHKSAKDERYTRWLRKWHCHRCLSDRNRGRRTGEENALPLWLHSRWFRWCDRKFLTAAWKTAMISFSVMQGMKWWWEMLFNETKLCNERGWIRFRNHLCRPLLTRDI